MVHIPFSLGSGTTVVLLSFLIHAIVTVIPVAATSGLGEEFYTEDEDVALPESTIDEDSLKPNRLLDLLQLRQSVSKLLKDEDETSNDDPESFSDQANEDDSSNTQKRVFCNNFTGCGGRFRGRRRMQAPNAVGKRFNGSKRNLLDTPYQQPKEDDQLIVKKLFCNIYGCKNIGKRLRERFFGGVREGSASLDTLGLNIDMGDASAKFKRWLKGGFDKSREEMREELRRQKALRKLRKL